MGEMISISSDVSKCISASLSALLRTHSSRHAVRHCLRWDVVNHDRTRSNHRVISDTFTGKYDCANPNLGKVANFHASAQDAPRSKVRIAADFHIVFDDRSGVDDDSVADMALCV